MRYFTFFMLTFLVAFTSLTLSAAAGYDYYGDEYQCTGDEPSTGHYWVIITLYTENNLDHNRYFYTYRGINNCSQHPYGGWASISPKYAQPISVDVNPNRKEVSKTALPILKRINDLQELTWFFSENPII